MAVVVLVVVVVVVALVVVMVTKVAVKAAVMIKSLLVHRCRPPRAGRRSPAGLVLMSVVLLTVEMLLVRHPARERGGLRDAPLHATERGKGRRNG